MNGPALLLPRLFAGGLFVVLWLAIGREDFLYQKVKNRRLAQGALAVAAGYLVLALSVALAWSPSLAVKFMAGFLPLAAVNVVLCAAAAIFLWYFKVWPAGDVKLFTLLSALLPLTMPFTGVDYWRVFFSALVNTFLPAQVFVFVLAVHYFVNSRLVHGRRFLAQLGWRREVEFLRQTLREAAAAQWAAARTAAAPYIRKPALTWPLAKKWFGYVRAWLVGMALMALLTAWAHRWVESPLVLSVGCTLVFASWGNIRARLGGAGGILAAAAFVAVLRLKGWGPFSPDFEWRLFWSMFGQIGIFSFFLYLGMLAMTQSMQGASAVAVYVVPLVSMAVMFVLGEILGIFVRSVEAVWRFFANLFSVHHAFGPLLPGGLGNLPRLPAWIMPIAEKSGVLAGFGLFFGLSLVLVRRWDQESRPAWRADSLTPRLLLAPDFVEKLREDDEFFEEHFSTMYPDGLTEAQAQALTVWCRENAVAEVPLAPTLSFASWIFFGYLLCGIFGGRHLLDFVKL